MLVKGRAYEMAAAYFGCVAVPPATEPAWQGLPLMGLPDGGRGSHWDTRIMRDDVMSYGTHSAPPPRRAPPFGALLTPCTAFGTGDELRPVLAHLGHHARFDGGPRLVPRAPLRLHLLACAHAFLACAHACSSI